MFFPVAARARERRPVESAVVTRVDVAARRQLAILTLTALARLGRTATTRILIRGSVAVIVLAVAKLARACVGALAFAPAPPSACLFPGFAFTLLACFATATRIVRAEITVVIDGTIAVLIQTAWTAELCAR